ncbi:MAG: class I SAM-dependent methyltransferase [Thermoproteota archaeon]|nr:class I SAM-dependent methyltransferase [Thermoproteota archaeon]
MSNNYFGNTNRFQLDKVAFYGRTLLEYLKMFRINDIDHLKRYNRILDCPSGASSFVAEANRYGINAVGCDPLFDKDLRILQKQGEEDIEYVVKRVSLAPNLYNWDFYSSIEELRNYRKLSLEQFVSDYNLGRQRRRYVKAELPKLPFDDKSFDLVLSGHFLFTYSHKFEFSFILSSIIELFRVCSREVRIYPLQKSSSDPYEHMTDLLYTLIKQYGISYHIVPVPFEFQKGSNKMLCLTH